MHSINVIAGYINIKNIRILLWAEKAVSTYWICYQQVWAWVYHSSMTLERASGFKKADNFIHSIKIHYEEQKKILHAFQS